MIQLEEFEKKVREKFFYLNELYGFTPLKGESIPFMHYIKFIKGKVMIQIGLAYRHDYLEIYIFRNYKKSVRASTKNESDWDTIDRLISRSDPAISSSIDYQANMPSIVGLDHSLDFFSSLLLRYGMEYIK